MVMPWPLDTSWPSVRLHWRTVPSMGATALYFSSSLVASSSFSWAALRAFSLEAISSSVFLAPNCTRSCPAFTSP